jgi:hypothetical protein
VDAAERVNNQKKVLLLSLAAAALITGCESPSIYYWGHYEQLIYVTYAKPGKATPESQVLLMQEDVQKAAAANKPLPPGFHAHLGHLYYQISKPDLALQEFQKEKAQFPASAILMDRFSTNLIAK